MAKKKLRKNIGKAIATLKMRQELDLETINNAAP